MVQLIILTRGVMKFFVLVVMSFLLLASFALADADDAGYLAIRADRISCTVNFHTSVISDIVEKIPQASGLGNWATKLQNDESQLKTLASGSDHKVFEDFIKDSLRGDLKQADAAVRESRKDFKEYNVSKEARQSLKDSFKSHQEIFRDCVRQNDLKVAEKRADYYQHVLDKHTEQIEKLSKRNSSTTEMSDLISQAQSTIVTPLKNAANSGDAAQAESALKQYCLWNGCRNGTNFHFAARFEFARLTAMLSRISPMANSAGLLNDISAVQAQLDSAKSTLASIGTSDFTGTQQRDEVWIPLKSAVGAFKKLGQDLRNERHENKKQGGSK